MEPGNARRLLEQQPPLDRLGRDNRADLALAHQGRGVSAGRGVREQQRHVLLPNVAPVDPIGRTGAALDAASDLAFAGAALVVGSSFDEDRHLGEIAWRPRRGAGEDHVVHAAAA